jgi:hypothetical protein
LIWILKLSKRDDSQNDDDNKKKRKLSNFSQLFKALAIRHSSRNAHATYPAENASERTSGKPKKGTRKTQKRARCTAIGVQYPWTNGMAALLCLDRGVGMGT